MNYSSRSKIIIGNWKMYKTVPEAATYVETLASLLKKSQVLVYLAVPFTAIQASVEIAEESTLIIGGQNMHDAEEGAFTGEISARMLKDAGAGFVLLGHSERRRYFGETNAFINRKVKRAIESGLQPILCIGESGEERKENKTENVLEKQITECLEGISSGAADQLVLAYEPVWAIGSGKVASPEDADEAHRFCRRVIASLWSEAAAEKLSILYGGSVTPENAKSLKSKPNVDGLLVGGASLSPVTFSKIIMA